MHNVTTTKRLIFYVLNHIVSKRPILRYPVCDCPRYSTPLLFIPRARSISSMLRLFVRSPFITTASVFQQRCFLFRGSIASVCQCLISLCIPFCYFRAASRCAAKLVVHIHTSLLSSSAGWEGRSTFGLFFNLPSVWFSHWPLLLQCSRTERWI